MQLQKTQQNLDRVQAGDLGRKAALSWIVSTNPLSVTARWTDPGGHHEKGTVAIRRSPNPGVPREILQRGLCKLRAHGILETLNVPFYVMGGSEQQSLLGRIVRSVLAGIILSSQDKHSSYLFHSSSPNHAQH